MLETKQKHSVVGGRVGVDNVIMLLFTAQRLIVCARVRVFDNYQRLRENKIPLAFPVNPLFLDHGRNKWQ